MSHNRVEVELMIAHLILDSRSQIGFQSFLNLYVKIIIHYFIKILFPCSFLGIHILNTDMNVTITDIIEIVGKRTDRAVHHIRILPLLKLNPVVFNFPLPRQVFQHLSVMPSVMGVCYVDNVTCISLIPTSCNYLS